MSKDYKKALLILFTAISLIVLASFQIAVINRFAWGFNIFLVLILFLILAQKIYSAIFLGWLGSFLIDTAHFSAFGVTSLTMLFIIAFLIIFQKKILLAAKNENILIISALTIFFYHFGGWMINNLLNGWQENFNLRFFNGTIIFELLLTVLILFIMLKSKIWRNA